jgi:hypothetical protein
MSTRSPKAGPSHWSRPSYERKSLVACHQRHGSIGGLESLGRQQRPSPNADLNASRVSTAALVLISRGARYTDDSNCTSIGAQRSSQGGRVPNYSAKNLGGDLGQGYVPIRIEIVSVAASTIFTSTIITSKQMNGCGKCPACELRADGFRRYRSAGAKATAA